MTAGTTQTRDLDALREAVWAADEAWQADLGSKDLRDAYRAAKKTFRDAERVALDRGATQDCHRCGGKGGWEGWPGFTCYECGGSCVEPLRKTKFAADPATRAKREDAFQAEQAAKDAAFGAALDALPERVGKALRDALAEFDRLGGYYSEADPEQRLDREVEFRVNLAHKVRRYGGLTEAQVAAVERGLDRQAEREAEEARVAAAPPLTTGRQVLEGEVVSHRWQDGQFGAQHKMLVRLDDGCKVWGTVPEAVQDATRPEWDDEGREVAPLVEELKGARVRFTATVVRSDDDEHFGFFSRPTKAEVLV